TVVAVKSLEACRGMKHIRAFVKSSLQLDNDHAQTLNNHHVKVVGTSSGMQHIRAVEMQRRFHTTRGEPFSEQNLQRGL
ncbi:hypothetical protein, partial [Micrococcus luteus]|uniref:hypothetical protein n=1 Tax=Micrococcus luteus TaxID=1270 RepID=UPI00352C48BB